MMKIKNAIIIHGPGRSGTTLLSSILSLHEDLSWISGYVNKYPNHLELTCINKLQNYLGFEKFSRNIRRMPRPSEAYNFWTYYIPDFNSEVIHQVDQNSVDNTIAAINKILYFSGKDRFVTKLTGDSRWQYLDAIFENPIVLWINRNPEAVIMSYYKNKWGYKDNHQLFNSKEKQVLIKEYFDRYKHYVAEREQLKRFCFFELHYEDLVDDNIQFFKQVCELVNLPFSKRFESIVTSWEIRNETNKAYLKLLEEDDILYLKSLVKTL
ncbi:hypothetical protein C1T31_13375 [Hanstruepera neustonica]|uniref:Sulfotransferase family protein n=1 Tax=Hanstruepera neustonica TaxID=1445657 RepID=A0A2K1DVN3_9FLAO|nr:sulfotransferase [Hanstruepera neustonica]PNQ72091.1 hypothetical protein C1T31_13375 [Hanstruepera neustonica]